MPRISVFYGIVITMYYREHGVAHAKTLRWSSSTRSPSMAGMPELVHVTRVEVVGDHRLRLAFEESTEAELDFADWQWRGVFEPLADPAYFGQVILDQELGTIVWPNGADVAPETLHAWALAGLERAPA